jgi:hypothetical protein
MLLQPEGSERMKKHSRLSKSLLCFFAGIYARQLFEKSRIKSFSLERNL